MKLSLNWLRTFINLPTNTEDIGEKKTIHTAEQEEKINKSNLSKVGNN